jgi:hypothetical protein
MNYGTLSDAQLAAALLGTVNGKRTRTCCPLC